MEDFEGYLKRCNLAKKTITAYLYTIRRFFNEYNEVTKANILSFKEDLIEDYSPRTVNIRILAINKYLKYIERKDLQIKLIKLQQKSYLENVISDADYNFLKAKLKRDKNMVWYFVVRYLCATGARVGELVEMKIEHVRRGYYDIYSKGGKIRRIFIPKKLQKETMDWLKMKKRETGYLFKNRFNKKITSRGVAVQLKILAKKYGLNPKVVYPHSFRHRFAKNFLEKYNDIALLADLMGHENIETTRIYLRKTSTEQQEIVDRIVTW